MHTSFLYRRNRRNSLSLQISHCKWRQAVWPQSGQIRSQCIGSPLRTFESVSLIGVSPGYVVLGRPIGASLQKHVVATWYPIYM